MVSALFDLLINPGRFFKENLGETEKLTVPGLIVLAGAIIGAIYGYLLGSLTATMMDSAMTGMGALILVFIVVGAFIGVFLFWLIATAIFFLLSKLFKGEGSFNRSLEVVGYGYLPQIIGQVITLAAAVYYLPNVTVPQLTSAALQDTAMMTQATKSLMLDPAMVAYTEIAAVVTIVFMLWSANIWIFGIAHARKLSVKNAAICVGAPIVIYVAYLCITMSGA
ncbi:MAG: Yip1 family protein [Methanoregula sp.]|jgi:hypothetical protein